MNDRELIQLIIKNPDQGIHEAMQIYGKAVNTITRSILKDYDQDFIDEAVSDTFVKLWKNISNFQEDKGQSLKSYLYVIARNTAFDVLRKQEKSIVYNDIEDLNELKSNENIENIVEKKHSAELLHQLIEMLGSPDNRVFLYKYFLGMKNAEIAEKLRLSDKQVENILYRGKGKLRKMFAERGYHSYDNL